MAFKKREIHSKLITKFGFTRSESSHEMFSLYIDGQKIVTTHTSRSHKDIDNSLLLLMAREMGVNQLNKIKKMFSCTISRDEYIEILKTNNYLN